MKSRILLAALASLLCGGCALSKSESSLSRWHDEAQSKKKVPPAGSLTEAQVGLKFYPDADIASSREYDEGGAHIFEVVLGSSDSADKVRDFYEKEVGGKSMPMTPPISSIQRDFGGKHYEVDYGQFGDQTTITIKVSRPTG